jgi:COP9 signalosome complex subunit 1
VHLFSHVHDLTNLIRNWAVVLYFKPFSSIKLERMSAAFGWTVQEVEEHVVALIQSGDIHGRVDSQNKVCLLGFFTGLERVLMSWLVVADFASEKNRSSC